MEVLRGQAAPVGRAQQLPGCGGRLWVHDWGAYECTQLYSAYQDLSVSPALIRPLCRPFIILLNPAHAMPCLKSHQSPHPLHAPLVSMLSNGRN